MIIKKKLSLILIVLFVLNKGNAQSFFTVQIGDVVYSSSSVDKDSLLKKKYATLCNDYISKYSKRHSVPFVYIISINRDSMEYELSYDNLMGNSTENKEYNRKGKYDRPGLRILISSKEDKSESILKMLEYGLLHLKKLKRLRKHIVKKVYYDQPDNLSISHDEILAVLQSPTSLRVKNILKD